MGYTWRVILVLVVIVPFNLGCGVLEVQYGNVSNDQAIEVDSRLVFRCHLYPEVSEKYGVTSKDLILKFRKEILTDVHQVDEYTVEYIVPHAGLQHNGMYNCFVPIAQFPSPQLVCSSIIYVGYKPLEVTNFTCISLGYQNLTCSWTPPQNNVKTEYILYDYLLNNPSFGYRRCPAPDRRSSSCTFRLDTKPPYIPNQPVLNFILNGTNDLGKISQQFTVNHYEIVKPGEPNLLKVSNVSKTNLMLHIGPPKALENGEFKDGLIYSIKYFSVSNLNTAKEKIVKSFGGVHVPISDLVPHTLYKFEVCVRLNISGDHYYWGNARTAIEQTQDDVPYQSPVIDNSAFDVQVIAGYRTVTIYWKAVPSEYENGNGFHYVVKYHEHYVPSRYRRTVFHGASVRLSNSTTHSFKNLDVDTAYLFNVFAANAVGNSSNLTAVIVVDKNRNLLPGPKEITVISYNQGHYDVSWVSPDDSISDFTLFWCKTFNFRPAKCDGPIDWITTGDTHKKLLLPKTTNYQFAVAARQDKQTSGMVWAPCTVTYGAAYSISKIELIPKNSTSLKVRWSHKCEAQKRVNREYSIHYCPFEGSCKQENWPKCNTNDLGVLGWPSISLTNTTQTEYTLSQLKPFTCYFAYLRIRTDSGWGENSDYAFETTLSSAPSDPPSSVDAVPYPAFDSPTASVQVSFHPPSMPNGIITRYNILYNRTTPTGPPFSKRREVWVQELEGGGHVVLDNLFFYSNYSVEVIACVDRACSQPSQPVYFYTGIAAPSEVSVPRVELLDTYVNVTWDLPSFPNGPVDLYQVRMRSNGTEVLYNVSEQRQFVLERQCEADLREEIIYSFEVRALNIDEEDRPLFGEFSSPVKTIICPSGFFPRFGVGFIVGGSFVVIACVFALYICYKWTKNNIIEAKRTEIHLPKELESSLDNPLSSYDKFKSGLQNNHDSGIPNDRTYERFFAVNGDLKLHDERSKRNGVTGGRNLSGDSTASGKGQDSISSANTSKTHNSMDSGAEVESPPSPDSFCCKNSPCPVSRDSGLDKDSSNLNVQLEGWCVRRPNMTPETGRGMSLANSEPSVADFDVGDGTEPLVNPVMQPYCKFGLARSASNGIDFPSSSPMKPGYSKFGIVYRPRQKIPKIVPPHFQSVFMATTSFAPMLAPMTISYNDQAYSKFGLIDQQDLISPPVNGYCSLKTAVDNNLLVWEERDIVKPPDNPDLDDEDLEDNHSVTADDCLEVANDASWNVCNVQKSGGRLINNLFDSSKDSGTNDKPSQIPVIICQGINANDPPKVLPTVNGSGKTNIVRKGHLDDSSSSSQGSDIMYVENLTFVEVDPERVPLSSIEIPQDLQLNFDFSHLEEDVTSSSDQDTPRVVTGGTGSGFVFNQSSPQMIGDSDLAREIREALKDVRLEEDDSICKIVQQLSPDTTT